MKKTLCIIFLICIFVLLPGCDQAGLPAYTYDENIPTASSPGMQNAYTLSSADGEIHVSGNVYESDGLVMAEKSYVFPNNDRFGLLRFRPSGTGAPAEPVRFVRGFEGNAGSYRSFNSESGEWEIRMLDGELPLANIYITIDGAEMVLIPPLAYTDAGNGSVVEAPASNGRVNVTRHGGVFYFEYEIPLAENTFADTLLLESDAQLIDWQDETLLNLWTAYDLTHDNRFLFDGYYYKTPENYVPSGEGYFWKIPSAYTTSSFIITGGSRAADDMGVAMMDILRGNVNNEGYFPTLPKSSWLAETYGVGHSFYDTRFNTDIFNAYLIAYQKFEILEFLEMAENYTAFFKSHAESSHYAVGTAEKEGWLVEDYSYVPVDIRTHVSLNHQAAEICYLYRYSEVAKDKSAADLALKLLQGIRHTGQDWIRPDGNLHYAYLPDGTFGMPDYPYLTYNDLFELRRMITARTGRSDPAIDLLMGSKKQWMDQNKITGYRK